MGRTAGTKLTEEDFRYFDFLHRRLARNEQILQRRRCLEPTIHHRHIFKCHREWRVHEGSDHGGSVGFDIRQCQLAAEPGLDDGFSGRYRGHSHREVIELEVVQFWEHTDEVQECVGMYRHALHVQRSQVFREVAERTG